MLFTGPKRELPCHAEQHRKAPGSVRRQKSKRKVWARAFIAVSLRNARQGKVSRFRID